MSPFFIGTLVGAPLGAAIGFFVAALLIGAKYDRLLDRRRDEESAAALIAERERGAPAPEQSFAARLMAARLTH